MNEPTVTHDTVEAALDRIRAAWDAGDAAAYAAQFTEDATYVIYVGLVYEGREAIERGHAPVFSSWQRGSRMPMRVRSIRYCGDDLAVVVTEGGVGTGKRRRLDKVQTFTMVHRDGLWRCAAFQNTKRSALFLWLHRTFESRQAPVRAGSIAPAGR